MSKIFNVPDLERCLYDSVSHSRSLRQRKIRKILNRKLGIGVGRGYQYQWSKDEFDQLLPIMKKMLLK